MRKLAIALAFSAATIASPSFAATQISSVAGTSANYNNTAGATTVLTFSNTAPTTSEQYAAALGVSLVRTGTAGRAAAAGNVTGAAGTFYFEDPNPADANGFFGVGGTGNNIRSTATFTIGYAASVISFYAGSIDAYNQIELLNGAGAVIATFSGTDMNNGVTPAFPGGDNGANRRVTVTGTAGTTFSGIRFSNSTAQGSFEFDNLAFTAAVPEPATWAMMLVGFAMVGAASRYRRRTTGATFA